MNNQVGVLLISIALSIFSTAASAAEPIKTVSMSTYVEGDQILILREVSGDCSYIVNIKVTTKKNTFAGFELLPSLFYQFDIKNKVCREVTTSTDMKLAPESYESLDRLPIKAGTYFYLVPASNK